MEESAPFVDKLEDALAQRRDFLESNAIPRIRDGFHGYQSALKSIIMVLTQKSLIHPDPYKQEQKISEVTVPSSEPMLDSDKTDQISIRLSDFDNQLDFLINFYQLTVDFLDLNRVRLLSKLIKYIAWDKLSETSGSINTKVITQIVTKVRLGNDKLSIGLLSDGLTQIVKAMNEILACLRDLTSFHRESYKCEMRRLLFDGVELHAPEVQRDREEVLKKLKQRFVRVQAGNGERPAAGGGLPYYPELIGEILDEDYSEYGENLRRGVLDKLVVKDAAPEKRSPTDLKPLLLDGIRALSSAASPMELALQKLTENSLMLETRKVPFGERVRNWFVRRVGGRTQKRTFAIEITDPTTAITRVERLDYDDYSDRVKRRSRSLGNLSNRMSKSYAKLEAATEEQVYKFISTAIDDVHKLSERMPALETYFKSELSRDERVKLRTVKLEMNAIKNALVKANAKRHDYTSRKEEREQLKRLGIDAEA